MARTPKSYTVLIGNTGAAISCRADQTLLEAAILAGIDYPYTCASGNCAACVSQLDAGKIDLLAHGDAALSADQAKAGRTLACRARPKSDITITWLGRGRK